MSPYSASCEPLGPGQSSEYKQQEKVYLWKLKKIDGGTEKAMVLKVGGRGEEGGLRGCDHSSCIVTNERRQEIEHLGDTSLHVFTSKLFLPSSKSCCL